MPQIGASLAAPLCLWQSSGVEPRHGPRVILIAFGPVYEREDHPVGLSGSSTKQTYTPSPQQTQAASTLTSAYQAAQPYTDQIAGTLRGAIPGLASQLTSTAQGVGDASSYLNNVLGGAYLNSGNPYLSGIVSATNNDITDKVNGSFSAAGRTGSGANQYALAKALGENETSLRYGDYDKQLTRMDQAAANAGTLDSQTLASVLGLSTTAANLPLDQAAQYASGIGSLNIGGTTTTTSSPSFGAILGSMMANAAAAAKYA